MTSIIVVIIVVSASSLLSYGLFREKLNKVSGQLNSYDTADYLIIYVLNYGKAFNNECLYPDTDIQFYRDPKKFQRLTVSAIMREEGVSYDLRYLDILSSLNPGEVCLSRNVADRYKLTVGDTIFAEYSYSPKLVPVTVTAIIQTEFDYIHPSTDNEIGVVFLGFNENYANSTNGKFILFAKESKTDELAIFPQIIKGDIYKSVSIDDVAFQGVAALVFEALFSLTSIILAQMILFSKSRIALYRCYLKGMKRFLLPVIPLLERLIFCLLPCIIVHYLTTSSMPDSSITDAYRMTPVVICGVYCIIMFAIDSSRLRRKGVRRWNS